MCLWHTFLTGALAPAKITPPFYRLFLQSSTRSLSRSSLAHFFAMSTDLAELVTSIARRARAASLVLATTPTERKNEALVRLAELLPAASSEILAANARDLAAAQS
ncbi:MAG: hypothetical protein EAZ36_02550, partial [Verrucomicrobia bacterium]